MSVLMEWEEPQSVIDSEWSCKYAPQIRAIQRICAITTGVLSLPILWGAWSFARSEFFFTCVGLFTTGIFLPTALSFQLRPYKFGRRCRIDSKRLYKSYGTPKWSGYDGKPFKWAEIKTYEFVNHPELSHIRRIIFLLKGHKGEAIFNFAPEEVNEQHLQAILKERLT